MDIHGLQTIVQKIADQPAIKARLDSNRQNKSSDQGKVLEMIQDALKVVTTGVVMFSGGKEKGRDLAAYVLVLGLLVELSILIKREFLDDPEIQARLIEAWTELETQSSALATAAKAAAHKVGEWLEGKNPVAGLKKLTT